MKPPPEVAFPTGKVAGPQALTDEGPSVLSEGGPGKARDGCGGDPYRRRTGYDEWSLLFTRVGGDAYIAPKPYGRDRFV